MKEQTSGLVLTLDMLKAKRYLIKQMVRMMSDLVQTVRVFITPGECNIVIMPGHIHQPGKIQLSSHAQVR